MSADTARSRGLWFAPILLGVTACTESGGEGQALITVFAAASTAEVIGEVAGGFGPARVRASFGPSSGLARQIEDGAPADVFISANRNWMEYLEEAGTLVSETVVFCGNRLVCIAPEGSRLLDGKPVNATELLALLADGDRVAIANAGVPAGDYARQSLTATGVLESLIPQLVGQEDVRAVLRSVRSGQAVAGFVYRTDARVGGVAELFAIDPSTHEPIEYMAAVVGTSSEPEAAQSFLKYLESADTQRALAEAGFVVDRL